MDNLNTHWSLDVCRLIARWCRVPFEPDKLKKGPQRRAFLSDPSHRHVVHFTPKHGSWLNQAELFFGVLHRRFLAHGSFPSVKDFTRRLERFLTEYNTRHAHPYRWTYTGEPLVRDTPFSRTRHQQRLGRACFSPRPKRFERLFYAPRPYCRHATWPSPNTPVTSRQLIQYGYDPHLCQIGFPILRGRNHCKINVRALHYAVPNRLKPI